MDDKRAEGRKAFYDAVIGVSKFPPRKADVLAKAKAIKAATIQMFKDQEDGTSTGRGNTKEGVQTHIRLFEKMVERAMA